MDPNDQNSGGQDPMPGPDDQAGSQMPPASQPYEPTAPPAAEPTTEPEGPVGSGDGELPPPPPAEETGGGDQGSMGGGSAPAM